MRSGKKLWTWPIALMVIAAFGRQDWPADAADARTSGQNIVVFLSDDHGYLDTTTSGATDVRTPNMQRLADAGMTFTHAFVASPACAPSRAALLTGMMPARNGAEANHTYPRDELKTLPAYLQELGYEVAAFGKVAHGRGVARHGFDHQDRHYNAKLVARYLNQRDTTKPLCLFVGTHQPHVPWPTNEGYDPATLKLPPTHLDTPESRQFCARYYTDVTQADTELGEINDLVGETLGANTLFIYTSDHGSQWPFGKGNLYDAGIRVPFIATWPDVILPGSAADAMISWIDLLPTFIDLAGDKPPTDIDGRSFADELFDLQADPHEESNLAPLAEYQDQLEQLRGELAVWMKQQGDRRTVFSKPHLIGPDGPQPIKPVGANARRQSKNAVTKRGESSTRPSLFAPGNLVAWCIVPFDAKKRGPADRAEMLVRLGLKKVAYDWRQEHVPTFEREILEYKKHGLEYFAFWSWHPDMAPLIKKHGIKPQIWSTSPSPEAATQKEKIQAAAQQLMSLVRQTRELGCKLGLYNHGGWGGEPANLVAVCQWLRQQVDADHVGIVYNLHHGHDHIPDFAAAMEIMKPYLLCLNLNGMNDGAQPKILPIGAGQHERRMMRIILDSGYDGPIGILDHRSELDAEESLRQNLKGLANVWVKLQTEEFKEK